MEPNKFIKLISTIPYRPLDKEFKYAEDNKELITPYLLDVLKNVAENIDSHSDDISHRIAVYFLAKFREKKAYPLIIKILGSMTGHFNEYIFSDDFDALPNLLASTFNGDVTLLYGLIENSKADEFSRVAAMESLIVLWQTKQ